MFYLIIMNKIFIFIPLLFASAVAYANTAVSAINGKVDSSYGNLNSIDAWINEGSFSAPVADAFGVQLDALYADVGDTEFGGFGGHLFWRDYEVGLFGITAGGLWSSDVDTYEISLEGEYYYGLLTFGGRAGFASIDFSDRIFSLDPDEEGAFGFLYAMAYPVEDLSILTGLEYRFDSAALRVEAEYQLPIAGLSIFAQGMFADDDYEQGIIGLRYYFGADKNLQERHRQDDPRGILKDMLTAVFTYSIEGDPFYSGENGTPSNGNELF